MGDQEAQIIEQNGELVGVYYQSLNGGVQPLASASQRLDMYGWAASWRANDDAQGTLWNAGENGVWLFPWTPFVLVLDTKTMTIVDTEGDQVPIDALAAVTAINQANP